MVGWVRVLAVLAAALVVVLALDLVDVDWDLHVDLDWRVRPLHESVDSVFNPMDLYAPLTPSPRVTFR